MRIKGEYDSSQRHVIFSNDADMILLSLLLHEPNVFVMRDIPARRRSLKNLSLFETRFELANISILRQYLSREYNNSVLRYQNMKFDLDRFCDDFVFLSYFVGNDFVPNLPFMNMRDGALEFLLNEYVTIASKLPDYITNGSEINMEALQCFFHKLCETEASILVKRYQCFLKRHSELIRRYVYKNGSIGRNATKILKKHAKKKRKLNDGTAVCDENQVSDTKNKSISEPQFTKGRVCVCFAAIGTTMHICMHLWM